MYITYDENYKSVTELLFESRNMLNELKNQCIKLSDEKEKLIMENIELKTEKEELVTDNLNLMAAVAEFFSKVEMLTEENKTLKAFIGDIPGFSDGDNLR